MTIKLFSRPVVFSLITFVLCACAPAAPASTAVSTPSAVPVTSSPSSAAAITQPATLTISSETPTPEQTPIPPLPAQGPYFAFLNGNLTLIGANNVGREEIPLPDSARTGNCLACVISPDGQWLAYWTGFAGEVNYSNQNQLDPNGHYDLQLNLFHISEGTTATVTGLLSPDYPASFQKNAEAIKNQSQFAGMDVASIANGLSISFLLGIESAAWSPDSRYLAFAGEKDGPSSDLYVYDISEKSINRLSSGSTNIISSSGPAITWSPDGKWIVYTSAYFVGEGMTVTFHAALPDGSQFWDFTEEVEGLSEWVSPSVFLTNRGENGIGEYGLRINNLDTGGSSVIWQCSFGNYRYDPEDGFFIVENNSGPSGWDCLSPGLYFGFPSTVPARLLFRAEDFSSFPWIGFLGQGDRRFLLQLNTGTFVVSSTGEKTLIGQAGSSPSISPDRQWVAFAGKGLSMMDASGQMSDPLTDVQADNVNWRPDSQGFLFSSGSDLYSGSLPDEVVTRMDGINYPSDAKNLSWQPDSQGYFFSSGSNLYFLSLPEKSITFIQEILNPELFDPVWVAVPK